MQNWEEKISTIEQKIYKLVEINRAQQQNYAQLRQSEEALAEENDVLRQQLADAENLAQTLQAKLNEMQTQMQTKTQEQPQAEIEPTKTISDQPPAPNVQPQAKATVAAQEDTDFAQEKEFIRKQISQYIRDIDATVSWIQSLSAPTA